MSNDSKTSFGSVKSLSKMSNTSFRSVEEIEAAYDERYDPQDKASVLQYDAGLGHDNDSVQGPFEKSYSSSRAASTVDPEPYEDDDIFQRFMDPDELNEEAKNELCSYVFKNVLGTNFVFHGPFGKTLVTYLDYVASGRPLKCFETYIRYHVMPTYANTHSEVSYYASQTTQFREEARSIIKQCINANENDAVIFCGSGSTAAIHKIIHAMGLGRAVAGPTVFVGPYEHHSNILPWKEIQADVIRIRQNSDGLTDLEHLETELRRSCRCGPERLLIGSFSAASNVTGILTDTLAISLLMHKYKGFALFDYACAAPYVEIDMNCTEKGEQAYKDAVFISPHKFVGGPQTPGILVAKRWLFKNKTPHGVGGGTVVFVRRFNHTYLHEVEHREEGGTPAIIESIRAGLVFRLKQAFSHKFIMSRENEMFELASRIWGEHPNILILGNLIVRRLPIFSMLFLNPVTGRLLHHDFVAMLLNDLFGIQDLLGMTEDMAMRYEKLITDPDEENKTADAPDEEGTSRRPSHKVVVETAAKETQEKREDAPKAPSFDNIVFRPGFVRLNFPYFLPQDCFSFVIKAILMTAEMGWLLLPLYDFNRKTGKWRFRDKKLFQPPKSLYDISFLRGRFDVLEPDPLSPVLKWDRVLVEDLSITGRGHDKIPASVYDEILQRARLIFEEANTPGRFDRPDMTSEYTDELEELRWFMLPSEAADIVNKRPVIYLSPEYLPFFPEALEEKLGGVDTRCMYTPQEEVVDDLVFDDDCQTFCDE